MQLWRSGLFLAALCGAAGIGSQQAAAQAVGNVSGGLNSNNGAIYGSTINRVLGTNPNGTPRQQNPGASMTNGTGSGVMGPGPTSPVPGAGIETKPETVPPTVILHGQVEPSGQQGSQ